MKSDFRRVAQQTVDLVRSYISADGTGRVAIIAPDDMVKPLRRRVYEQLRETLPARNSTVLMLKAPG